MKRLLITGAAALALSTALTGAAAAQNGGPRGADFETLDRTGDGRLTAEDIVQAADARFAEIDANGDGDVTEAEFLAHAEANAATRAARIFARLDADGDGVLSRDVLEARGGKRMGGLERLIDRFDADGDGGLDEAEFETARAELRERGGPRWGRNR